MDNVSVSGERWDEDFKIVTLAAGQEIWRTLSINRRGEWMFAASSHTCGELYYSNGEKFADLPENE